ncbi:bifunctional phosphopantothenoylcysteine decarboxylase/phosphopantothenate--cysteine ligase CoaBC [Castellaniella caeni]|uniref:bifunctional phosphopantothenoylcysteine decarboxylase/phosphopantothenate--cysteine ligase CoaBC n=1 Tax=Castellaniella caeni TaxID=266123 RepID=UPI000834A6E3|nr:bifunctional phosphopantothenoylcysteine decarboxylase/phosphopantothenate--cysteine ligase CoaBC [Castellaniella caeni]
MPELSGKRIILGLTGGIACYKSAELLRRLQDEGATVDVVMTAAASRFITAETMQALSGRPVWLDAWDARADNRMAHINLTRGADAVLIVPASTDFLAKLAHGLADDLLSTLCVARGAVPLLAAPAMNHEMWTHPATQRNAAQLLADGVTLIGPAEGSQACGETGSGRMMEPDQILRALVAFFQPKVLAGRQVLITAGPTSEPIDPVRVLTNRSSGRMGYALARAAAEAGARVTLVSGPTALPCPDGVSRIDVRRATEMRAAVMARAAQAHLFIAVAAVADWGIANPSAIKLKKQADGQPPVLDFVQNPDILAEVAALPDGPWCVGFAAETDHLHEHAQAKRARKGIPVIVGNLAQQAMDAEDTELVIFDRHGAQTLPRQSKLQAARALIGWIAAHQPSR